MDAENDFSGGWRGLGGHQRSQRRKDNESEDEGWVMSWEESLDQDADGLNDSLPHYIQQGMKIIFNN